MARLGGGLADSPRAAGDHELVVATRRGDDRAFEELYARYYRPVAAYVLGMVKDHGRAEDVTQDVFLSALRRLRETDRPISFEAWIYAIARNACIDHFRRSQRALEVPFDADEGGPVAGSAPAPDAVLSTKQELDHLRGAFHALSDAQHEVLVLRELEGLSHREIGERMGLSRVAVESALARARRRLAVEFEELASGARCHRIQRLVANVPASGLDSREEGRLGRHVAHCQPCRRAALAAGIDVSGLTGAPLRRRAAARIATFLPLPALARLLRGVQALPDQLHAGAGTATAAVAIVVAGAGAGATGVGTEIATDARQAPAAQTRPANEYAQAPASAGGVARSQPAGGRESPARDNRRVSRGSNRGDRGRRSAPVESPRGASGPPEQSERTAPGAGEPAGRGGGEVVGGGGRGSADAGDGGSTGAPAGEAPAGSEPGTTVRTGIANTVGTTVNGIDETVGGVTGGLDNTLEGVGQTLQGSPEGLAEALQGVDETVEGATGGLGSTVESATDGLDETLAGVGDLLRPPR